MFYTKEQLLEKIENIERELEQQRLEIIKEAQFTNFSPNKLISIGQKCNRLYTNRKQLESDIEDIEDIDSNKQHNDHLNLTQKLFKALEMQRPEADYESDDEMEECVKTRFEVLDEARKAGME